MGASFIDYVITDRFLTPPDQQDFYDETFVYLPDVYQPNSARTVLEKVLGRSQCGLPAHGFIFCSFNDPYKITREVFEVWMRILRETPGSVLWLQVRNDLIAGNLRREAQERGIDAQRLIFAARRPMPEYLALYRLADLFLDTWPYNAGATASDALWMGLPLLTKAGATYASRMAGSLLHAAGLPELVTISSEQYEAEALRLAHDRNSLGALRTKLAGARDSSPLFDIRRYAGNLERAYEEMWRKAVSGDRSTFNDQRRSAGLVDAFTKRKKRASAPHRAVYSVSLRLRRDLPSQYCHRCTSS
jgi:protein O-GlcNAc transferase